MGMMKIFLLLFTIVGCTAAREFQMQEASSKCSDKSCGQMSSCDEAIYNYMQCGRKELDKDGDGSPCDYECDIEY